MTPLRILVASVLCIALAACESPRTELEAKDIATAAQQLESIAGEASWLAAQLREGGITQSMAWVDQHALVEDAGNATGDIAKAAPATLRAAQERLAMAGAQLRVEVPRIAQAAPSPAELQGLQLEFQAVGAALHVLAKRS